MATRITDLNRSQAQLNQIRRQKVQMAQLESQMSSQMKTDSFSEMSKTTKNLLDVQALTKRTDQYIEDINRLDTKLSLMSEALTGVRKIASDFRTILANSVNSTNPPNVSDQASAYLDALVPFMNARDGTDYLFAGNKPTTMPVGDLTPTKIQSSTLGLRGTLPAAAPVNTESAGEPTAGSYVDVAVPQTIYDTAGTEYKMGLRYIRTGSNTWEARITSLTRANDGSSVVYNGKAISTTNSVRVGSSFNADTTLNALGATFDPSNPPASIGGGNTVFSGSMMPAGSTAATLTINLQGQIAGAPITTSSASASGFTSQVNGSPTQLFTINGNFSTSSVVGSTTSYTATAYDTNGAKLEVDVKLTKVADAGNPSLEARNLTLNSLYTIQNEVYKGTVDPLAPPAQYAWAFASGYLDAAGTLDTAVFDADFPPGGQVVPNPIYKVEVTAVRDSASGTAIAGFPQTLGSMAIPTGGFATLPATVTPSGGTLGPITIRPGTVTTDVSGGQTISSIDNRPQLTPGTQLVQMTGNLSSAAVINSSVASLTPGSYYDITFKDTEALIDSGLKAHNLTVRFVKESTAPDMWQAYAIGLTQASDGLASTDPAISATQPVKMGVPFDPTVNASLSFAPSLKNGNSLNVQVPLPANTFTTTPQAQINTIDLTGAAVAGDVLRVTVNGTEYTATGATAGAIATTMQATLSAALGADYTVTNPTGTSIRIQKVAAQAGVPFTLGYDVTNTGASTLGVDFLTTAGNYQANVPGAAVAQVDDLTITAGAAAGVSFTATVNGFTASYTTTAAETATQIRDGLLAALQRNSHVTGLVTPVSNGAAGITFTAVTPGTAITTVATPGASTTVTTTTTNRVAVQTLTRPENTTTSSSRTPTTAINLSGNLSSGSADNSTYDVRLSGNSALVDSNGNRYNATIRFTKTAGTPEDRFEARVVELTHAEGTSIGQTPAAFPATGLVFGSETTPTTAALFNPADANERTVRLVADDLTIAGFGTLSLAIPFNKNTFSYNSGATRVVPQGQTNNEQLVTNGWGTSLSDNIADTSYALAGTDALAAHQSQLSARIADDLTITYGVRADSPAFEKLVRVLTFFRDKSIPPTSADAAAGQALLDEALASIDDVKADLAMDQITLSDQRKTHQTTVNLAKNQETELTYADPTETALYLNNLKTVTEASYAALATIKGLSLVNYLS